MLAKDYAQGLYELGGKVEHLAPLKAALARRGHTKLLPHIFAEYQKIALRHARHSRHAAETKEQARTRALLELYRKLTA